MSLRKFREEEYEQLLFYLTEEVLFPYVLVRGPSKCGKTTAVLSVLREQHVPFVFIQCKLIRNVRQFYAMVLQGLTAFSDPLSDYSRRLSECECSDAWGLADIISSLNPSYHRPFYLVLDHSDRLLNPHLIGGVKLLQSVMELPYLTQIRKVCRSMGIVCITPTCAVRDLQSLMRKSTLPVEIYFRRYPSKTLAACMAVQCRPVFRHCHSAAINDGSHSRSQSSDDIQMCDKSLMMAEDTEAAMLEDLEGLDLKSRESSMSKSGSIIRDSISEQKTLQISQEFSELCVRTTAESTQLSYIIQRSMRLLSDQRRKQSENDECYGIGFDSSAMAQGLSEESKTGVSLLNMEECEPPDLSYSSKFLLICCFLASYNSRKFNEQQFVDDSEYQRKGRRSRKKRLSKKQRDLSDAARSGRGSAGSSSSSSSSRGNRGSSSSQKSHSDGGRSAKVSGSNQKSVKNPLQTGPLWFTIDVIRAIVCGLTRMLSHQMTVRSTAVLSDLRDFNEQLSQLIELSFVSPVPSIDGALLCDFKLKCNITIDDARELAQLFSFKIETFLECAQ